jgi:hypothetical protein
VDGAAAVRDAYRQAIADTQQRLQGLPDDPSEATFSQRLILTVRLIDYLDSWALVESCEAHVGAAGRDPLRNFIWPQLINHATATLACCDDLSDRSRVVRAARRANTEPHWSIKMADNLHKNVDHLARRMALLGKISSDADRVAQVFMLFGGTVGTHTSAEGFIQSDHDIPHLIQARQAGDRRSARKAKQVDAENQAAARAFIRQFFDAVDDRRDTLPLRALTRHLEHPPTVSARNLRTKLRGADITAAQYRFTTLGQNEFVARVEGVVTTRGSGTGEVIHARNLAFRFRITPNGLTLLSIGGLK